MRNFLNESFLHFLLGFTTMLVVSFSITIAISYYDPKGSPEQTAAVTAPTEER
ncbi:MAG: hypothetical protein AAB421_04270 [Patescibacteria group bacterium]